LFSELKFRVGGGGDGGGDGGGGGVGLALPRTGPRGERQAREAGYHSSTVIYRFSLHTLKHCPQSLACLMAQAFPTIK
jgi:hypothetical protein